MILTPIVLYDLHSTALKGCDVNHSTIVMCGRWQILRARSPENQMVNAACSQCYKLPACSKLESFNCEMQQFCCRKWALGIVISPPFNASEKRSEERNEREREGEKKCWELLCWRLPCHYFSKIMSIHCERLRLSGQITLIRRQRKKVNTPPHTEPNEKINKNRAHTAKWMNATSTQIKLKYHLNYASCEPPTKYYTEGEWRWKKGENKVFRYFRLLLKKCRKICW